MKPIIFSEVQCSIGSPLRLNVLCIFFSDFVVAEAWENFTAGSLKTNEKKIHSQGNNFREINKLDLSTVSYFMEKNTSLLLLSFRK